MVASVQQTLPSLTEAALVAAVTPNAPFRHLIFVFTLLWQLPGNGLSDLLADFNLLPNFTEI